jgi:subtilisin-like proprotein convertase family protein
MKRILTLAMVMATTVAALAQFNNTNTPNAVIPDNNANGLADTMTVSGLGANIGNVTVSLDITGGYNGDLYAYLAGPNTGFAVLLNRVGENGSSSFGYSDAGFNITLDDSAANPGIHFYQTASPVFSGGQLTGNWASDGENIDPQSAPSSFNAGSGGATLTSFNGDNGNGQWTLFLADLSGGDQSTLVSWSLDITAVPEPGTLALAALGGLAVLALRHSKQRRH